MNDIYCAGWNLNGALGVNSSLRKVLCLTKICSIDDIYIDHISCGLFAMHTFIWCFDRGRHSSRFWGFGNNKFHQFGDLRESDDGHKFSAPFELNNIADLFNKNKVEIISIECGFDYSLFLSKGGAVYSCGKNSFGQCGIKQEYEYQISPKKIAFLYNIRSITCGEHHSLCLDKRGNVYVFGNNVHGQLGIAKCINIADCARMNTYFRSKNIVKIECGKSHSICIDKTGNLWNFGRNNFGQCGNGTVTEWDGGVFKPHLFQSLKGFHNVAVMNGSCGLNHTVILTRTNDVYCFGENYYSQCSTKLKNTAQIKYPNLITKKEIGVNQSLKVKRVIAGYETTIIVFQH